MLEKIARIGTIFSVLCLGWLIPGMFAPPKCSKSSLVQSFDIVGSAAQSRVWNCILDESGATIALDHQHLVRDFEDKLRHLEIIVKWYGLPNHFFRPQFQTAKSEQEMELELIQTYLQAQPELKGEVQKLLPRLALSAFGRMHFKFVPWSPLVATLQDARLEQLFQKEQALPLGFRLRHFDRTHSNQLTSDPALELNPIPIPTLTVIQIDSRLTEVYARWNPERKILYAKGSTQAVIQASAWFGPNVFVQSQEMEFAEFLKQSQAVPAARANIRKVLWTPATNSIPESLIYVLNDKGSYAFAERSSSQLPFIEVYLPGLDSRTQPWDSKSNKPLLSRLLTTDLTLDTEIHQPASIRDLVTLYRWPPSP